MVYIVDSFVFYSRDWNEDRLRDTRLFTRASFDRHLAGLLLRGPVSRSVALDYVTGFSKINSLERFTQESGEDEAKRFARTYRPVAQIDRQRIDYLYPKRIDQAVYRHYLAEFDDLARSVRSRGMQLTVVKPPIPERVSRMVPAEREFDATFQALLAHHGIQILDFSRVSNDPKFFYDTDHLNRTGVLEFYQNHFAEALGRGRGFPRPRLP